MHRKTLNILAAIAIMGGSAVSAFAQITNTIASVSSASYLPIVSPNSIVSGWGSSLTTTTVAADTGTASPTVVLPTVLGNVSLSVRDIKGAQVTPQLYLVSPGQINYVLPDGLNLGPAALTVVSGSNSFNGPVKVSNVSPALYTADASGTGVPVGTVYRVAPSNAVTLDSTFNTANFTFTPKPISLNSSDKVFLVLYGTGIRNHNPNPPVVMVANTVVPTTYAGAQITYPGFDQVNIGPLPVSLAGTGIAVLTLFVDGVPSNAVQIAIR